MRILSHTADRWPWFVGAVAALGDDAFAKPRSRPASINSAGDASRTVRVAMIGPGPFQIIDRFSRRPC